MLSKIKNRIVELHRDEAGEVPVGTLLIIALIVVPLVLAVTVFRDDLQKRFEDETTKVLQ